MAENNIVGFKKLMRYAQNLAEYEQGIAEGIIDENVFVIVLDEKVAKFKGQTFDWSGGISQATADARYIRKIVDEFDTDLTFAIADGIVGTDDEYYFIPEKAPSTALDSQILATKADIPELDTSALVTKEEFADVEEVWAASYNLLNQKISDVQQYIYDEAASRRQFDEAIAEIQSIIAENESVVTAAWNQLNTRINALEAAQRG